MQRLRPDMGGLNDSQLREGEQSPRLRMRSASAITAQAGHPVRLFIQEAVPRVLVVDDEPDVCFIISSILRNNGFDARESHGVEHCLNVLTNYCPDFIILDIDLPDGSGLEALLKIHTLYPGIRVVMNSALDTAENQQRAKQNGAYAFLSKPLNKKMLLDALLTN